MSYSTLKQAILDLAKLGDLLEINEEVDGDLEAACLHRLAREKYNHAIYFTKIKGSPFPAVSNLFGTEERAKFLLRHA